MTPNEVSFYFSLGHIRSLSRKLSKLEIKKHKNKRESLCACLSPIQAENTAKRVCLVEHGEHVNLIHDHMKLVPGANERERMNKLVPQRAEIKIQMTFMNTNVISRQ